MGLPACRMPRNFTSNVAFEVNLPFEHDSRDSFYVPISLNCPSALCLISPPIVVPALLCMQATSI